jgi:hypothetical protein
MQREMITGLPKESSTRAVGKKLFFPRPCDPGGRNRILVPRFGWHAPVVKLNLASNPLVRPFDISHRRRPGACDCRGHAVGGSADHPLFIEHYGLGR